MYRLVLRSLRYYWRTEIVILLGLAVATAIIIGSLLVGDSVTGSLRDTALSRLGKISHVLVSPTYFRDALAADVGNAPALARQAPQIEPFIATQGTVQSDESQAILPTVTVFGIDGTFWSCFPGGTTPELSGRQVAINTALARDLHLKPGDSLLLTVGQASAIPGDTLFAKRKREDTVHTLRLRVTEILPDAGVGVFTLGTTTATPRNLFLSRDWLASQLGKDCLANALAVAPRAAISDADLQSALSSACTLADYGLSVTPNREEKSLTLRSAALLLNDVQVEAVHQAGAQCGATVDPVSVYLATTIANHERRSTLAYAIVAGTDREITGDGIRLNQWAATDLGARVGDHVTLSYLIPSPDGSYRTGTTRLTVRGIVPLSAASRALVPDFDGMSDAERIDEWNTPFPVDLNLVTPRDETYWERYRATPKAFVSLSTAQAMWQRGSPLRPGRWLTTLRLIPAPGRTVRQLEEQFPARLLSVMAANDSGMLFRPLRQQALDSAAGTTDFGQLFLAMSCFLIAAAASLAGMLLRLMADRRASMAGIMRATGFSASFVQRVIRCEGLTLALAGALLGIPLGILYTRAILHALTTSWHHATGAATLWLHVTPQSVVVGTVSGAVVGTLAVIWGTRRLTRTHLLSLLAGNSGIDAPETAPSRGYQGTWGVSALTLAALVVITLSATTTVLSREIAFFIGGTLLLVASLMACRLCLMRIGAPGSSRPTLARLALRSAAMNRGRSLLVIILLASATFLLVTVAANTRDLSRTDWTKKSSGTGGFALRAVSSLPVSVDFSTPAGRENLGFPPEEDTFRDVQVIPFLAGPGDDISCLNIAKTATPRVLGVMPPMIERGGFSIATTRRTRTPWTLLQQAQPDGAIPAFADAESVKWALHSGLGRTYTIVDGSGKPVTIRFVGLIAGSIFAGDILIDAAQFRRLHPAISAPRVFLLDAPPNKVDTLTESLRGNLGDLGVEVRATGEILQRFAGVQNTYLSTFTVLGGLGLLLGVVGMVTVLLRSALERRKEFALMLATGVTRGQITRLLLLENGGLLLCGILCGTIAALVAVFPQVQAVEASIPWASLLVLLSGILCVGLSSCLLAGQSAVRDNLLTALREE